MRRILLCGSSLLISGLHASLSGVPDLDLQVVDSQPEHIRERIAAWNPEVLILESDLLKKTYPISLLQDFPAIKLISLDIEDNRLLVFSGSAAYGPTPKQLLDIIQE